MRRIGAKNNCTFRLQTKLASIWISRSTRKLQLLTSVIALYALVGCSIFNPHVNPGIDPPYFPQTGAPTRENPQANTDQDEHSRYAGGVVEAYEYAHAWQAEYYDAVGNDSLLRSLTVVPVVGAAAAALVLGITSSSPSVVAALSVGGAAALGTSLYLQSAPRQKVYLEGYKAINCAIAATGPYVVTSKEFTQFQTDLDSLRTRRQELTIALNDAEPTLGSGDEAVIAAKEALARATTVAGNGQLLSNRVANAGRNLTARVDDIAAQVSIQITETEPDPQAITSLVSGLSGVTSIFGVAPPPPAEASAAPGGVKLQGFEEPPPSDLSSSLRAKTRDLTLVTDLVNERVAAADKAVEESGVLKACAPADVLGSLVIRPRVDLLPVKPGQAYVFSAEGGAGPVTATFNGQMLGQIVQEGANFTLTVAADASGSSAIQFSDVKTTRTITLVVDRGIKHLEPPSNEKRTELKPAACSPVTIVVDRTTLRTPDERDITEAQIRAIQKGLGVTPVDGRAGETTRGFICGFEKGKALQVTGRITQPLIAEFPVQEGDADEKRAADTGEAAAADQCASPANTGKAEGARSTGIEPDITPRRLCDIQIKMGIQPTGAFDPMTRDEIRSIRENRLGEDQSKDLTELTQDVINELFSQ